MDPTFELAAELIRRPSVTPEDAGCQALIAERLALCGFHNESLVFDEVTNLWSRRGTTGPLFVFLGHTDVVPTGPTAEWTSDPFEPSVRDGCLYGRGAADMKGSVAAMVTACERFVAAHPDHAGSIAVMLTSDEEGPAVNGVVKVMQTLSARNERIDWCLVGEPSSVEQLGDMVKVGRRGSLGGQLTVHGIQGHVAYPHRCDNPVHRFAPALAEIVDTEWDRGNEHFPPTTFQVSNIAAGTGASNVVPGELSVSFNFRYSTELDEDAIKTRLNSILDRHGVDYDVVWATNAAKPFLTRQGPLIDAVTTAIKTCTGVETTCSTEGGTSDGRFVAPTGAEVVELGPVNASIHQIDEHTSVIDLERLSKVYEAVLERMLT